LHFNEMIVMMETLYCAELEFHSAGSTNRHVTLHRQQYPDSGPFALNP